MAPSRLPGGYQPPLNPITQTPDPVTNLHYYDNKGRSSLELAKSDGKWFYTTTSYDTYSRPSGVRHYWKTAGDGTAAVQPYVWEDFGYVYAYDAKSYLLSLTDSLGRDWWSAPAYDYLDRVTSVKKGNGYTTTRMYRPEDGVLTAITTGSLQNMSFGFDGLGNLRSRTDAAVSGGTESFGYDNLNRLTGAGNTGTVGYFANGNIQTKNDVLGIASGTYTYDSTHPHAVASAFGFAMTYDPNGNLLTRTKAGDQSGVTWTGFDKPRTMWRVTPAKVAGSEFHYNANRSRVMQLEFDNVSGTFPAQTPSHYNRKRVYALGSTLELNYNNAVTSGSGQDWKLDTVRIYVPGPDGIIGAREFKLAPITGAGTEKALVYHYDHLGSITAISDWGATGGYSVATGSKAGRYSEDPWGQRRDPLDWNGAVPAGADDGGFDSLTPRGFTGHEMLDDLGLVHMNGRIYDPLLGRFLSADRAVQFPGDLQSYNRYSYVNNNPLRFIDPSGFELSEEKKKRFEEYKKSIAKLGYNVAIEQNSRGGAMFVFTKMPSQGAAAKATAAADNSESARTPLKERSAVAAPESKLSDAISPAAPSGQSSLRSLQSNQTAPNSVTLAAASGAAGSTKPVFNAGDVAGVMNGTAPGQALLGRLKTDFAVKTADVYVKDASGNLIPATGLIGGYAKGTTSPALIVLNNLATTTGGFKGTDAQFYTYVLIQEVNEFDLFRANTPGSNKQVEVINRVNAENQAKAMGLPEAQPGYRTPSGAVDTTRITQDVASNPGYTGPTHGSTYIVRNGVLVKWP